MRARKRFGQHFLHDAQVLQRITDAVALKSGQRVLEIGPGTGALTEYLAATEGTHYTAVEIDRDLGRNSSSALPHCKSLIPIFCRLICRNYWVR